MREMNKTPMLFEDPTPGRLPCARSGSPLRGLLLVVMIVLGARLVGWTGAYSGAMILFRIEFSLGPPYELRLRELEETLADPQSDEHRALERLVGDFGPVTGFDGNHYESIVNNAYRYKPSRIEGRPNKPPRDIAFFPLYPLICTPLTKIISPQAALVLVSNICAMAAAIVFFLWIRRRVNEPAALFGVACMFFWPAANYYGFGYAESLTLLLTVVMLYFLDRRWFIPAAIACGLATASRPTAAALIPVFMLAVWVGSETRPLKRLALLAPLSILAAAGILSYAGYLTYHFGSPLVYFENFRAGWTPDKIRSDWFQFLTLARVWDQFKYVGRIIGGFPPGLIDLTNPFAWNMPMNFFILFLSLAGLPFVPRRFKPMLLLGPFIFLQAYLASGGSPFGVEPISRYTAVAAPAFVVLGAWAVRDWKPAVRHGLLAFMLLLQFAWALRFGMGEWSS